MHADGTPQMAFGVMGGPMQSQGHLQMALRVLRYGRPARGRGVEELILSVMATGADRTASVRHALEWIGALRE